MRYEGDIYRPPSEADAWILQATIGCSWNACTYCDMYRAKRFRVRETADLLQDISDAKSAFGSRVEKVFIADGDALAMGIDTWLPVLSELNAAFPQLRRVSAYATAMNLIEKPQSELSNLARAGLTQLYIGPESGDDTVLKAIAKGATAQDHVDAAHKAKAAGMKLSAIFLLGAGGTARSLEHARASAALATAMDPEFLAALTLTVLPQTPLGKTSAKARFELPDIEGLLHELRIFVAESSPSGALFRTNHASNYLPISGQLPQDRDRIVDVIDRALSGEIPLRPEGYRGL